MAVRIRRKEIKSLVEKMLHSSGIDQPPISVEKIAKKLNLEIRVEQLEGDISGCIIRQGDRGIVGVNTFHHENRQRFTVAHEIGHFLLHKGNQILVDRKFLVNMRDAEASAAANPEEVEANFFAAELLMPERFLSIDIKGKHLDIEDDQSLRDLAERYQVSTQALTYRLANLGYLQI